MRLPLKLAYPTLPGDADEIRTTIALIRHAVAQKFPQGLPRVELRVWGKLEAALEEGLPELELSTTQWAFLRDAVHAAAWPVPWTKLVLTFLDALDEIERQA